MIDRGCMKVIIKISIIFMLIVNLFIFSGCKSEKPEESKPDKSITQQDIDLFIKHKYKIDEITAGFDEKLKKSGTRNRKLIFEEGKKEINKYLESKELDPEIFMQKSKKILKCYLAFRETDDERIEKKRKMLEEEKIPQSQIKEELKFYKSALKRLFKSYTEDLSEYEVRLIRSNIEKISKVVDKRKSSENE